MEMKIVIKSYATLQNMCKSDGDLYSQTHQTFFYFVRANNEHETIFQLANNEHENIFHLKIDPSSKNFFWDFLIHFFFSFLRPKNEWKILSRSLFAHRNLIIFFIFSFIMEFDDDVWKIIRSYLFDEKQVQYRYLIKQINENLKKAQQKKRGLEILESIMSEVQSDSESEYDDADDEDC